MVEFYQVYVDYKDLMDLMEEMLCIIVQNVLGKIVVDYQGEIYDFGVSFVCMIVVEFILYFNVDILLEDIDIIECVWVVCDCFSILVKVFYGLGKL